MPLTAPSLTPWPYPRWIAHRGAGRLAPENTLAAFRLGAQYGYRMFECDAKLSSDGIPFLLHDTTLDRTTDARMALLSATSMVGGDHPWGTLAQLDAGSWYSRTHAGEPLATLASVARFCIANGYCLNIEIKPTPGWEEHTGRTVAEWAARLWQGQPVQPLLSSFHAIALAGAQARAPHLPRALLLDALQTNSLGYARDLGCAAVVCNHALWSADLVAQVKGYGMRTLSYTVNDEWAAQRLIALGTDGIITDRVDFFSPVHEGLR